jgi:hypothetical protein
MTVQDRADFVSVAEVACRLGISTATVKRRIAAGTLEAEQLQRPQGFEYRVRLTRDVPAPSTERSDSEPAPPLTVTMQDVSAAIAAATSPLMERLAVQDANLERQAGIIRGLERENGRLSAELAALSTAHTDLSAPQQPPEAPGATEGPAPTTDAPVPWWKRWRSWLAAGLVVAVVGSASCGQGASARNAGLCSHVRGEIDFQRARLAPGRLDPTPSGQAAGTPAALANFFLTAAQLTEKVC